MLSNDGPESSSPHPDGRGSGQPPSYPVSSQGREHSGVELPRSVQGVPGCAPHAPRLKEPGEMTRVQCPGRAQRCQIGAKALASARVQGSPGRVPDRVGGDVVGVQEMDGHPQEFPVHPAAREDFRGRHTEQPPLEETPVEVHGDQVAAEGPRPIVAVSRHASEPSSDQRSLGGVEMALGDQEIDVGHPGGPARVASELEECPFQRRHRRDPVEGPDRSLQRDEHLGPVSPTHGATVTTRPSVVTTAFSRGSSTRAPSQTTTFRSRTGPTFAPAPTHVPSSSASG